jgi:hypothetical protein
MRNHSEELPQLISGPMLGAYLGTLTIILGWSGHRGYLEWFGIDPAGVDGASAETTINYIGFGIEVITRCLKLWIPLGLGLICYTVYELSRELLLGARRVRVLKNCRILICVCIPIALLIAFFMGRDWAEEVGHEVAREQLRDAENYFRPISISGSSQLPTQSGAGCWRKILQDKKHVYVYWQGEDIRLSPTTYAILLDNLTLIEVSSNHDCR